MSGVVKIDAHPWPVELPLASTALLCIDLQHDFCSPEGWDAAAGLDVSPCAAVVPKVAELLKAVRQAGMTTVHTREGHLRDLSDCPPAKLERSLREGAEIGSTGPLGRFLIRGEPGHAILDEVAPLEGEPIIDKPGKDAFLSTSLHPELGSRGITHLLLAGVTTECCVSSTLRTANDLGYRCVVIEDACASPIRAYHRAAIEIAAAIFGCVTSSGAVFMGLRHHEAVRNP